MLILLVTNSEKYPPGHLFETLKSRLYHFLMYFDWFLALVTNQVDFDQDKMVKNLYNCTSHADDHILRDSAYPYRQFSGLTRAHIFSDQP